MPTEGLRGGLPVESFKAQFRAEELEGSPADLRDRAVRFFDYLRGRHAPLDVPVRDVADHDDRRWWESDFPAHSACRLRPEPNGPWLVVNKVPIPVPPNPPAKLDAVLDRHFGDPAVRPSFVDGWVGRFGLDPEEVEDLEARLRIWLTDEWDPWAERAKHANTARSLYQDLFDLYLRLLRQDSEFELIWGHGFLTWRPGPVTIRYPLVSTPCAVTFNADTGEIDVSPDGRSELDLDFLRGVAGLPPASGADPFTALRGRFGEESPDPWGEGTAEYLEAVLDAIGGSGEVGDIDPPVPGEIPNVTTRSLLFVRRRVPGYTNFFERMRELLVDGHPLPAPLHAVLGGSLPVEDRPEDVDEWTALSSNLRMSLPSNAEQEEVARRLADNDTVTVQGPPGTGKTHTIANITGHLLAHGKRVLVTSFKQQPLEILREMIPEEVRPLCVSVLGSSARALEQLERSVKSIRENAIALDTKSARARIDELEAELERRTREVDEARRRLAAVDAREGLVYILGERELTPADLGRWLVVYRDRYGQIPDPLGEDQDCPLTRGEVTRYFELCRGIDPGDRREGMRLLPDWGSLPDGASLRRMLESIRGLHARLSNARGRLSTWAMVDGAPTEDLAGLVTELGRLRERIDLVSGTWLDTVAREVRENRDRLAFLDTFVVSMRIAVGEVEEFRARVSGHRVQLPRGQALAPGLRESLEELRRRQADSGKRRILISRELRDVREGCNVDGRVPDSVEDYEILLSALGIARARYELSNRWNAEMSRIGGPILGDDEGHPEIVVTGHAEQLAEVLDWERSGLPAIQARLSRLGFLVPERLGQPEIDGLLVGLDAAFARHEYRQGLLVLEELAEDLRVEGAYEESSPLFADLAQALMAGDADAWEIAYREAVRLDGLRMEIFEADELGRRLSVAAPVWAARIAAERGEISICGDPADVAGLWQWRQADTWLSGLIEADDPGRLETRLEDGIEGVRTVTEELAAASAWLGVAEEMTEPRRRSLSVWAQALKRVREAQGPTVAAWRAEADAAMKDAVAAIPVWIMPLYRVVEVFDPADEPFDVVVVDESSQCDLFSIAALGLARKAIVVGDDMQLSPQTVVIDPESTQAEIGRLIPDIPNASLLEPDSSLYDLAKRSFRGAIMLREHFRCLPEIIEFSNDLSYDGRIFPLREANPDPGWSPLNACHVPDGYRLTGSNRNPAEAAEIVELIARLCADPAYEARTMGVVSLLGDEQAHMIEEALIARLGESEIARRRLRCGDPFQFQGDERDVMFVSMVVAPDDDGLTNRPFVEEADRRSVNVAASRARDQVWLLHSVSSDQLHPDDVRGRLVRFCSGGRSVRPHAAGPGRETELERELAAEIRSMGYEVAVHHGVGRLSLDLLVEGRAGRLALEIAGPSQGLDGWADDRRRREVLERLGWRFHHIRGSEFHRDRPATMERLRRRLASLGIEPVAVM